MYDESAIEAHITPFGLQRYRLPAVYPPLNKHRYIASDTAAFALHKAAIQEMIWTRQFNQRAELKHRRLGLEMNAKRPDLKTRQKQRIAEVRTELARQELSCAYQLLAASLRHQVDFDWDKVKERPAYPQPKPAPPELPEAPMMPSLPREPRPTDSIFTPVLDSMDKLRRSRREEKEQAARQRYEAAHQQWRQIVLRVKQLYQEQAARYQQTVQQAQALYRQQMQNWEAARERYEREREHCMLLVDHKKAAYLNHDPHAVLDYCDMALTFSEYPVCFPHSFELDYDVRNRLLIVDYLLPPLRVLPRLAKVVYNEDDNAFHELLLSEEERNRHYARLLYEIPLRVFHELFTVDSAVAVAAIQFRGYLHLQEGIDITKPPVCVLDVHADRAAYASSDLYHTDPAVLFESLGGTIRSLE